MAHKVIEVQPLSSAMAQMLLTVINAGQLTMPGYATDDFFLCKLALYDISEGRVRCVPADDGD